MKEKIWIVIAAYNEGVVIADVVSPLKKAFQNIVVVDDGSSDETGAAAEAAGAALVTHPINLGQGAALQTGIVFALNEGASLLVTFDADGQHRVQDAIAMIDHLRSKKLDIVCGSRFLGVESRTLPFTRRLLLRTAAIFTRLTSGVPVTDAHNGLRVLSAAAARKIRITQNRMAHASEIITHGGFKSEVQHLGLVLS